VTPQMLKNTWHETEYHLDILQATNGAYIKIGLFKHMKLFLDISCILYSVLVCNVVNKLWSLFMVV
jgi:hypothetical protein